MLRKKPTLFGVIDHPKENQLVGGMFHLRGWVISRDPGEVSLRISLDDAPLDIPIERTARPDVLKVHKAHASHNPTPGFSAQVNVEAWPGGSHVLKVSGIKGKKQHIIREINVLIADDNSLTLWDKYRTFQERTGILLMHIPKTAGTSLNAYLATRYAPEHTALHAENLIFGRARHEVDLDDKHFISAHLKLDTLSRFVNADQFFKVTVLRDPYKQTISHLAWVKRLGDPKNKNMFDKSPDYIKKSVDRISRLGLAEFIDTMGKEERSLFDNCQTRYLLPFHGDTKIEETHLKTAVQKLNQFDLIGLTERFDEFLFMLAFYMGWPPPKDAPQLNKSRKAHLIDLETEDDAVKARIDKITYFDRVLYDHATTIFERQVRTILKTVQRMIATGSTAKTPTALNASQLSAFLREQA